MAVFGNQKAQSMPTSTPASAVVVAHVPIEELTVERAVAAPVIEAKLVEFVRPSHNNGLAKAQAKRAELRAAGELKAPERIDPVEKAKRNPKSLRCAITAMCFQCVGAGADPNPRQSVRDCQVNECALWPQRPWQSVAGKSADQMTEAEVEEAQGSLQDDFTDDESEVVNEMAA